MKALSNLVGVMFTLAQFYGSPSALAQAAPTPAQSATVKTDGPRIKFSETSFDFGKVKATDVLRHDFTVTNTGNALLEITEVRPGCGCTTAGTWDRQIEPGKTGKIPIQLNPTAFNGTVAKSITVTCNDPTQSSLFLQLQATVWRAIDVQPPYASFTPVEGEETNETKVVRIVNNMDEPLSLDPPQCPNPAFKLEMKTLKPGKEFELHITYGGPVSNSPPYAAVKIKTSNTNTPALNVSVSAAPRPALVAMPAQISLPAGPLRPSHRHSEIIRNNSSKPVKLSDPAVNADGVKVELTETQPGKLFTLNLNFPANFQAPRGQPLELTVKTTHAAHPVLKVPIIQLPDPAPLTVPKPSAALTGQK